MFCCAANDISANDFRNEKGPDQHGWSHSQTYTSFTREVSGSSIRSATRAALLSFSRTGKIECCRLNDSSFCRGLTQRPRFHYFLEWAWAYVTELMSGRLCVWHVPVYWVRGAFQRYWHAKMRHTFKRKNPWTNERRAFCCPPRRNNILCPLQRWPL